MFTPYVIIWPQLHGSNNGSILNGYTCGSIIPKTFHLHLHTLVYPWFKLLFSDTWILWWIHGSNDCSSALRYLGGSIVAT